MATRRNTFTFVVKSQELLEVLKQKAQDDERSVAWLINHYIEQGLIRDGYLKDKSKSN